MARISTSGNATAKKPVEAHIKIQAQEEKSLDARICCDICVIVLIQARLEMQRGRNFTRVKTTAETFDLFKKNRDTLWIYNLTLLTTTRTNKIMG